MRDLSTAGKIIGVEALIWMAALIFLALTAPVETAHFTICPFSALGIIFVLAAG